jgi:hypothetical protein
MRVRGVETRAGALRRGRRGEGVETRRGEGLRREHGEEVEMREGGGEGRDANDGESKPRRRSESRQVEPFDEA